MGDIATRLEAAEAREKEMAEADLAVASDRDREMRGIVRGIWDHHDYTEERFGEEAYAQMREDYPNLSNDASWEAAQKTLSKLKEKRELMSKPGELAGSDRLLKAFPGLEEARWQYMIPDDAWKVWPTYDRVMVYQVPQLFTRKKVGAQGILHAADVTQDREHRTSCEGIVISAGLTALDHLRSAGIEVGHRVVFVQNYMYRRRVGYGEDEYVGIMRSGDICAGFELAERLVDGVESIDQSNPTDHFLESVGKATTQNPRMED